VELQVTSNLAKPHVTCCYLRSCSDDDDHGPEGMAFSQLIVATLASGALSAHGANAINCYVDRLTSGGRTDGKDRAAAILPQARWTPAWFQDCCRH